MRLTGWMFYLGSSLLLAALSCSDKEAVRTKQDSALADQGTPDYGVPDMVRPDSQGDVAPTPDQIRPPAGWTTAQPMALARIDHTATLLKDGTVLVAGGRIYEDSPYYWGGTDQAERYDPETDTWQGAGTMPGRHWEHQTVLLQDGKVLVIGGFAEGDGSGGMLGVGVELFDPDSSTTPWTQVSPMNQDRASHRAVLLQDGRVLVVGGWYNQGGLDLMEIYDPTTDTWSTMAAVLSSPRQHPMVMSLDNGKVLIAGGFGESQYLDSIEIFDPSTGTISPSGAKLPGALSKATVNMLTNGKVLLAGGYCNLDLPAECTVEKGGIYDPILDQLAVIALPYDYIVEHTTTRLADGRVLLVGGLQEKQGAFLFDPNLLSWAQTADLHEERMRHTATLLQDGRVLVTGGEGHDPVADDDVYWDTAEIFTP